MVLPNYRFAKAAELLYTGKIINPETAKEWGLIVKYQT